MEKSKNSKTVTNKMTNQKENISKVTVQSKNSVKTNVVISNNTSILKDDKVKKESQPEFKITPVTSNEKIKFYKKQNILDIIYKKLKQKEKFTDDLFPPHTDSLFGKNKKTIDNVFEEDLQSINKEKQWIKASEIVDNVIISQNNFSPFDILQGALSNCYYMSVIAGIAKHPHLILNLFPILDMDKLLSGNKSHDVIIDLGKDPKDFHYENMVKLNEFYKKNLNILNCFIMKIKLHGEWNYILIDDYFPVYSGNSSLIFGKSNSNDLWVSILEKVWSKVLGGYYKTSLGSPAEGFLSLTDAPTDVITHAHLVDPNELWEKIKLSMKREWILACIIQNKGKKANQYKNIGLITNHCYSIIRLTECSSQKFLLLRNPHGTTNYSGNYNDFDSKWTEKLKKEVDFSEKDDGCFFMSLEDYFKYFDHSFLCKHEDDKEYMSYKIKKNMLEGVSNSYNEVCFLIKIHKQGKIYFSMNQKYKRIYGKGIKNRMCHMMIGKIINDKIISTDVFEVKYIAGANGKKSSSLGFDFEIGTYVLYTRIDTGLKNKTGFVLSTYGDKALLKNIEVNLINSGNSFIYSVIEKMLISLCRDKLNRDYYPLTSEINSDSDTMIEKSYKLAGMSELDNGFAVVYIENNNKYVNINTNLRIKEFDNLDLNKFKDKFVNNQTTIITNSLTHNLIYFYKQKIKCGFKIGVTESFSYNSDYIKANIRTKGEKKDIMFNNAKSGLVIYSHTHGKGVLFLFENNGSKNGMIKVVFTKTNNLSCKDVKKGNYELTLNPKEAKFLEFSTVEIGKAISIAYKYAASLK